MITIIVPGPPVPWARARSRRVGKKLIHFVDAKTAAHKAAIAVAARAARVECIAKPGVVEVRIVFHLPRPKRGKYKQPIDRRDLDNLAKCCLDALNEIAWDDDGQVCALHLRKIYDDNPRTEITIHQTA